MWILTLAALVLWIVNPELRRLYDWRFGFSAVEIISLTPMLALIPHVWILTLGGRWRKVPKGVLLATWLWIGAFSYGLAIAFASGNVVAGAYAYTTFVVPTVLGLWIASDAAPFGVAYRRVTAVLFAVTTIVSIYGVIQWMVLPPWDAFWLRSVISEGSLSFGHAAPFEVRVFSMLNSPGPFGSFIAAMLLLSLPRISLRSPGLLFQIPVWLLAFGLSLDRSGWLMFAAGALCYVLVSPTRGRLLVPTAVTVAVFAVVIAMLPVVAGGDFVTTSLSDRVATLSDLGNDRSASDRAEIYATGAMEIAAGPMGRGLGTIGTATKLGERAMTTDFDSGVLARLIELGVPGFVLLAAAFTVFGSLFLRRALRVGGWNEGGERSISAMGFGFVVALAVLETAGDVAGLMVLLLWLFASLALRSKDAPARGALAVV